MTANAIVISTIAGDKVIVDGEAPAVVISGTSTLASGTTVSVTIAKADGTVIAGPITTTVSATGTWSIAAQDLSGVTPNGTLVVTASATSTYTYTDVALPILQLGAAGAGAPPTVTITSAGDANLSASEDDAVTISGVTTNAPDGATVTLTVSDTDAGTSHVVGTATVSGGTWTTTSTLDLSSLVEGALTIDASVTANSQTATDSAVVNHDTIPPLLTITAGPTASDATPLITGTTDLSAGALITITIDADANGSTDVTYTATVQADGTWSVDTGAATPVSGSWPASGLTTSSEVTASGTDPAGNSTTIIATTIISITNDTGVSSQDFLTNDPTLIFTGKAEPGSSVVVKIDGITIGSTTTNGSGVWTYDYTGTSLAEATYSLTAVATKSAGVTATATQSFTVDLSGPTVAITSITDDTGTAGDFRTNDAQLIFNGTAAAGSSVLVTLRDSTSAVVFTATVSPTGGNWSVDRTSSTLPDDTYTLTATATDAAGNSTSTSQAVVVDTSVTLAITTNASTSDDTPLITGTTDIESGRTITIEIDPNNDGDYSDAHIYTATVQPGGTWSVVATTPLSGTVGIKASGTDSNANYAVATPPLTINVNAPTITITEPIGDGDLDGTEDDAVVISGTTTFVPAGATIQVTISDGFSIYDTTFAEADGSWTLDPLNLSAMGNGVLTVTATYTDDTGTPYTDIATVLHNKSGAVTIDSITVDTGALSDFITSDNTFIFYGSSNPNDSILLTLTGSGGTVFTTTVTADAGGAWSYNYTGSVLPDDTYTLQANTASQVVVVDTSPPAGPVTVNTQTTDDTTPNLTGTATVGAGETLTVTVNGVTYVDGDGNLALIGTNWSLTIPLANSLDPASADGDFDGVYDVTATIRNTAGLTLNDGTSGELTIADTTAPVVDLAPADAGTLNFGVTSSEGAIVSLDDDTNPATVVENSDKITKISLTVAGILDGSDEKLILGATTIAANGGSGTQNDITVGGVRINVTYVSGVFRIEKFNFTDLTTNEARSIIRDLQYQNLATVTVGARTFAFAVTDAAGNVSAAATTTVTVAATRTAQNICFCPPTKASRYGSVTLSATASSGLTVSFAVTSGPGSLAGNVLTFSGAGSVVITASQSGDATYTAAADEIETVEAIDFYLPSSVADGWTVTYGGEDDLLVHRTSEAKALAMQLSGDSAVALAATGVTTNTSGNRDIFTAKYDAASGAKLWSVIHGGDAGGLDEGSAVAMDSLGNVWIVGIVTNSSKNTDIYVAKYASADGALEWEHTFTGTTGATDYGDDGPGGNKDAAPYQGGDNRRGSIALGADGTAFITGYITNAAKKMDAVTIKYDASGNLAWSQIYNGPASGYDYGHSIAIDAAGNVFIAGSSYNGTPDALLLKYDGATGAQLWEKRYDSGKPDSAIALKLDSDGNPVISGYSQRTTFDFLTARYDSTDGSLIWMDLRDGPAGSSDMVWDFVLVDGTDPIITGTSYPRNGVYDGYTFRFNCPCSPDPIAWAQRYDGPAAKQDQLIGIGADMFGNPIVTGYSQNADGTYDTATTKYAGSDGSILWQKRYNGQSNGNDLPRQLLVDPAGNVFISGLTTSSEGTTDSWVTRYVATEPSSAPAQVINFLTPPPQGIADSLTLSATASSGLPVSYSVLSGPATLSGSVLTFTGTGPVSVRASQAGDSAYLAAADVDRTFTVGKSRQVLVFTLPATTTATTTVALAAMASSGLPITYTVLSGPATLEGSTLTLSGVGAVSVRASQAGDSRYDAAASVDQTFTVSASLNTIAFSLPATALATDEVTLAATAGGDLPVTYSVVSGPGQVTGSVLTFTDAGTVVIRASQSGNALYGAATSVSRSITVKKTAQTIAFSLPASATILDTVTLSATASSGLPVTYVVSGPGAISAGGVLSFTAAGRVSIRASQPGNAQYNAAVAVSKLITVIVVKPILQSITLDETMVGETVGHTITAIRNPSRYTATGLPPGVVLNAATGRLSGAATAVKRVEGEVVPYEVIFTASNAAGSSDPVTVLWSIVPLLPDVVGAFNGLVEPSEQLTLNNTQHFTGLGGRLSVVTTSTASYTGRLVVDTVTYAFTGKLLISDAADPSGSAVIRRTNAASLAVTFSIDSASGEMTGSVTDGALATPLAMAAWRNPWVATTNPATAYEGAYTAALELPSICQGQSEYPQGNGFSSLKLTAAGLATWTGKLADGTTVTASTTLGPDGQVPLHIPLYTPTVAATAGAANGWVQVDALEDNTLNGSLRWKKNPQASTSTTRSYKEGFPSHEIAVLGGKYLGTPIVLPPSDGTTTSNNAMLTFTEGGLEDAVFTEATDGEIRQAFRIASGKVTMPTGLLNNPTTVKLTIYAATGAFSGSFTLKDADPTDTVAPIAVITRTVAYSGVMVPRLNQGVGHFVLPQLPTLEPLTTITTSPQLSGQVLLQTMEDGLITP
ncbi:MAG: Ig-like domain-containing protein [Prosthecobacter sp.]|nr:Ig-like domain-containing protein [Prosthecobacter sp.]